MLSRYTGNIHENQLQIVSVKYSDLVITSVTYARLAKRKFNLEPNIKHGGLDHFKKEI